MALLSALEKSLGKLAFAAMQVGDVEEVLQIEEQVYTHPWTRGNFLDALGSGYQSLTMRDAGGRLLGYFMVVEMVDEAHLLNLCVVSDVQGAGCGRVLLDCAVALARQHRMTIMLLEVRVSNLRALHVYRAYGFVEIGCRKNYYPLDQHTREDAIVMSLRL